MSFHNLVDQNLLALESCGNLPLLTVFLYLQKLKPLDFHHEIELLLLFEVLSLELFLFFELLITHSDDLGVEYHLVHLLDVVQLLVKEHLGSGKHTVFSLLLFKSQLARRQLALSELIQSFQLLSLEL